MAAGIYDIIIEQYGKFHKVFRYLSSDGVTPIDLSGKVGKMQVRKTFKSTDVLVELSTVNGKMVLDSNGQITLDLAQADTAVLDWEDAFYDIVIDGDRILQGRAILSKGATRE